jgi:fatty acid desaturase
VCRKRILRNKADAHCLIFHGVALLAYGSAFWIYLHPQRAHIDGLWSMTAFIAASVIMLGWVSGIDVPVNFHNHSHRTLFTVPWLNRWVGRLWTFSGGWPSFFFEHAHVTVHHANLLGRGDWTLPYRRPHGRFESQARYSLTHWPWRFGYYFWRDFTASDRPPGLASKALCEFLIFLALWSIPFWISIRMALLLWVLPQWFGNVLISGAGMYLQHAGCVAKSSEHPYGHSNSSLSRVLNFTMFNVGYHTHHHEHPQVHWAQLPRLHEHMRRRLSVQRARLFRVGYYSMSSTLAKAWLRTEMRDARIPRHPEFATDAAGVIEPFELAGPRDYLNRHGEPREIAP